MFSECTLRAVLKSRIFQDFVKVIPNLKLRFPRRLQVISNWASEFSSCSLDVSKKQEYFGGAIQLCKLCHILANGDIWSSWPSRVHHISGDTSSRKQWSKIGNRHALRSLVDCRLDLIMYQSLTFLRWIDSIPLEIDYPSRCNRTLAYLGFWSRTNQSTLPLQLNY